MVNFTKDRCEVVDSEKNVIMIGIRLSNNYYHWVKHNKDLKCNLPKSIETILWHKRLGHLSVSKICTTLKVEAIYEVQLLKKTTKVFYSECSVGKQTKTSHKINK